jgi:hypothetical protein
VLRINLGLVGPPYARRVIPGRIDENMPFAEALDLLVAQRADGTARGRFSFGSHVSIVPHGLEQTSGIRRKEKPGEVGTGLREEGEVSVINTLADSASGLPIDPTIINRRSLEEQWSKLGNC